MHRASPLRMHRVHVTVCGEGVHACVCVALCASLHTSLVRACVLAQFEAAFGVNRPLRTCIWPMYTAHFDVQECVRHSCMH
jgi:hypothetical protein